MKTSQQKYPGPTLRQIFRDRKEIHANIPAFLNGLSEEHGDVVLLRLRYRTWLLRNPDDVKHVLITNALNYHKTGALRMDHDLFGEGIISSTPPLHTEQRKLMNPMFHRKSIAGFIETMQESTREHIESWREGDEIELNLEMVQLTLKIVGRTLFGIDLTDEAQEIGEAFTTVQRLLVRRMQQVPIPKWVPTQTNSRYKKALRKIDTFITDLIHSRRRLSEQPSDLLGMLIDARYEDGSEMEDGQMRDELVTLLTAGHETVSNALNWTFYLLSENPDADDLIHQEWQDILKGKSPDMEDFSQMVYTDKVVAESMRVCPPAWILARTAVESDTLPCGVEIRPKDEIILPPYVLHRNPKFFPDPDRFDPERWTPEFKKSLPAGVYLPFGIGPRYCIGEQFARSEIAVILATIGQRFRLRMLPGQNVEPEAMITMRPRYGLKMKLEAN